MLLYIVCFIIIAVIFALIKYESKMFKEVHPNKIKIKINKEYQMVNQKDVDDFKGELRLILYKELKKGNEIVETYRGDWPNKDTLMIFLAKSFLIPIKRDIEGITYSDIDDHHFWKAQYYDEKNNQFLICRFG